MFNNCIKNKAAVQLIELGNSHTAILNSKGKVYTYGWNNNAQCGVPINCNYLYLSNLIIKSEEKKIMNRNIVFFITSYKTKFSKHIGIQRTPRRGIPHLR